MTAYELPSLLALVSKLGFLAYASTSRVKTASARLFLVLLAVLAAFNAVEWIGLHALAADGFSSTSVVLGFAYFALFIPSLALFLHVSLLLAAEGRGHNMPPLAWLIYLPAAALVGLLLGTDLLVQGFQPHQYTVLRVPGPLYYLFEAYVCLYLAATLYYLARALVTAQSALHRARLRLWLLGLVPLGALIVYLIVANHFGWARLTSTVYVPIALTFFLLAATYATYQYRLFDVEFYIPGSEVRRRKTAFYDRIRAMIAEIADLDSVETAVERVGAALRCPVALVGARQEVIALASADSAFSRIPRATLEGVNHIVVVNEVASAMPELYRTMRQHRVAAIVPFHPHSHYAAGWLVLGEGFSNEVYTPRDFKLVEELFAKMGDLFLDKLLAMRAQLAQAVREVQRLEQRTAEALSQVAQLKANAAELTRENARLAALQPADSCALEPAAPHAITLAVLGRNKALAKALRQHFVQAEHYVGADSASFKRKPLPDTIVYYLESTHDNAARELIATLPQRHALLLTGPGAPTFVEHQRAALLGRLVEVVPNADDMATIARRAEALAMLARATVLLAEDARVLIGQSAQFQRVLTEARRLGVLDDAVLLRGDDVDFAHVIALLMHRQSGAKGPFRRLDAHTIGDDADKNAIEQVVAEAQQGTLFVAGLAEMFREAADHLLQVSAAASVRVIAFDSTGTLTAGSMAPQRPFELELPSLRERREDAQLISHYFTLQFNLRTGTARYLRQQDLNALLTETNSTLAGIRHTIADALVREDAAAPTDIDFAALDKTLDEYLAQFEARVLAQTLARCQGNKSQAARLLGLKPNTLHYKLERYGLAPPKPRATARDT